MPNNKKRQTRRPLVPILRLRAEQEHQALAAAKSELEQLRQRLERVDAICDARGLALEIANVTAKNQDEKLRKALARAEALETQNHALQRDLKISMLNNQRGDRYIEELEKTTTSQREALVAAQETISELRSQIDEKQPTGLIPTTGLCTCGHTAAQHYHNFVAGCACRVPGCMCHKLHLHKPTADTH